MNNPMVFEDTDIASRFQREYVLKGKPIKMLSTEKDGMNILDKIANSYQP